MDANEKYDGIWLELVAAERAYVVPRLFLGEAGRPECEVGTCIHVDTAGIYIESDFWEHDDPDYAKVCPKWGDWSTVGCLLGLVRLAWGHPGAHLVAARSGPVPLSGKVDPHKFDYAWHLVLPGLRVPPELGIGNGATSDIEILLMALARSPRPVLPLLRAQWMQF